MDVLALHPDDNVATALRALPAGAHVQVRVGGADLCVELRQPIPMCHKVALRAVKAGAPVFKYGEVIGVASRDIAPGDHVHIHNLVSARARQR